VCIARWTVKSVESVRDYIECWEAQGRKALYIILFLRRKKTQSFQLRIMQIQIGLYILKIDLRLCVALQYAEFKKSALSARSASV